MQSMSLVFAFIAILFLALGNLNRIRREERLRRQLMSAMETIELQSKTIKNQSKVMELQQRNIETMKDALNLKYDPGDPYMDPKTGRPWQVYCVTPEPTAETKGGKEK